MSVTVDVGSSLFTILLLSLIVASLYISTKFVVQVMIIRGEDTDKKKEMTRREANVD